MALYDYVLSAMRHFEDARLLDREGRLHNAAQLHGLGTECAVKAILIESSSVIADADGGFPRIPVPPSRRTRPHLDELIPLLPSLGQGRLWSQGWNFISGSIGCFSSWSVEDRYKDPSVSRAADHKAIDTVSYPSWKAAADDAELALISLYA